MWILIVKYYRNNINQWHEIMCKKHDDLQKLYQRHIINWSQRPVYKKDDIHAFECATEKNPLCGDIITVGLDNDHNQLYWDGEGCMICSAAAEAFCEAYNDGHASLDDAQVIIDDYQKNDDIFKPFEAFQSIKDVPQRIKCVTLVAKAVQKL